MIRTPHMLPSSMTLGTRVSPAPRRAPAATMEAAKRGSAKASMRNTWAPRVRTPASGVSMEKIQGAAMYIKIPVQVITPTPRATLSHAKRLAWSLRSAPMLCPTRVVAAAAMP